MRGQQPIRDVGEMAHYSQRKVLRVARVVAMMTSSLLPIGAIFALNYVHPLWRRLALVAGFSAAFSLALGLLTRADIAPVFAASAA